MFNSYARIVERSFNQYMNFSKILQDSVTTAVDLNLKASKNYVEWMLGNNLMNGLVAPSIAKKAEVIVETKKAEVPAIEIKTVTEPEVKSNIEATVTENKIIKKTIEKKKSKNALYQV